MFLGGLLRFMHKMSGTQKWITITQKIPEIFLPLKPATRPIAEILTTRLSDYVPDILLHVHALIF